MGYDYEAEAVESARLSAIPKGSFDGRITEADGTETICTVVNGTDEWVGDFRTIKTADDEVLVHVGGKLRRIEEWQAEQEALHDPPEDE